MSAAPAAATPAAALAADHVEGSLDSKVCDGGAPEGAAAAKGGAEGQATVEAYSSEASSRRSLRAGASTEALMIAAWSKSGLDFLAPVAWEGAFVTDNVSALIAASAVCWLGGCVLLAVGAMLPCGVGRVCSQLAAPLWTLAGALYSASLAAPTGLAGWSAVVSATTWLAAGLLWTAVEWKLVRGTRAVEAADISLWGMCGLGFCGACAEPSLSAAARWTWCSSAGWWCVGVASWGFFFFCRDGSWFGAPAPSRPPRRSGSS